jgi:hypothetical protein
MDIEKAGHLMMISTLLSAVLMTGLNVLVFGFYLLSS